MAPSRTSLARLHLPWRALIVISAVFLASCGREPVTRWTMLNVTPKYSQADCHLIELPDGRNVLIDVAEAADAPGVAVALLKERKIRKLNLVVISHFHWDHYGKISEVIDSGIQVDRVAISMPGSREIADVEKPWGADWEDIHRLLRFLEERRIPFFIPWTGERLLEIKRGDEVMTALDVVCLYDGVNTPVGRTDMNDTSIVVRLTHGPTRALFTGDLNQSLGAWLAKSDLDLKADILKVPHHGTEGVAPNEFFAKVDPKIAMVPSPRGLWLSLRSKRIRDYFLEHKIPAYVTGIHGTVTVEMTAAGYTITAEHPDGKP